MKIDKIKLNGKKDSIEVLDKIDNDLRSILVKQKNLH